jgi:hypothetical protein
VANESIVTRKKKALLRLKHCEKAHLSQKTYRAVLLQKFPIIIKIRIIPRNHNPSMLTAQIRPSGAAAFPPQHRKTEIINQGNFTALLDIIPGCLRRMTWPSLPSKRSSKT